LRQRQGIREFTDDKECLLRISLEPAGRDIVLSDGTVVHERDTVLHLHFWNEHLPVMPSAGPSAAWANLMKKRMRRSLIAIADHLARDHQFDDVRAVHGAPPFGSRLGALQMTRIAQRFGFDVVDPDAPREWRERIHVVFDSMLLWGLTYTFNPSGLKAKGLLRYRHQLWISRRKLLLRYGAARGSRNRSSRD
jgi:hypothetical protein